MTDGTDATAQAVCAHCGAARVPAADWCPRCLERYDGRTREVAPGVVKTFTVQSRTQKGPLTLGLLGRVVVTLPFSTVIALLVRDMVTSNRALIDLVFLIPVLGVGGFLLRDVWDRTPKHVPPPPSIFGEPVDPTAPKPILPPDPYLTDP